MSRAARAWRIVFAVLGWSAIAVQLWLSTREQATSSVLGSAVVYFSYFTTQTNVLAALALTAPVVAPDTRLGRWTLSEGVRAAVAMYIAVVALIYHFLLNAHGVG